MDEVGVADAGESSSTTTPTTTGTAGSPTASGDGGEGTESTTASDTTGTGTGPGGSDDGGEDGGACSVFLPCLDVPCDYVDATGCRHYCDFWAQDCAEGQKCLLSFVPDGHDGLCYDVVDDPAAAFEPCERFGGNLGGDTCDADSLCVAWSDETEGHCYPRCLRDAEGYRCLAPLEAESCIHRGWGTASTCFASCDPLLADCPPGLTCSGGPSEGYQCYERPPVLAVEGESCSSQEYCAPGLDCVLSEKYGTGCEGDKCCAPYCEVGAPDDPCPRPDHSCVPIAAGSATYGHLGRCEVTP